MLRVRFILLGLLLMSPSTALAQHPYRNDLRGEWRFLVPHIRIGLAPLPRCRLGAIQDFKVRFRQRRAPGGFSFELFYDQDPSPGVQRLGIISGNSFSMTLILPGVRMESGLTHTPPAVRLRGVLERGLNELNDDITAIVGTMNCGSVASEFRLVRDDPNRKPANISWGTSAYYLFREQDFRQRHPGKSPPAYYRQFGARYVDLLSNDIRSQLSVAGARFVDVVAVRLQQQLETTLLSNPAGYDVLEQSGLFVFYAYATHVSVYCSTGWENLPERDRDLIIGSIERQDKYNPLGPQFWTTLMIGLRCGHFQDGVPDWPWIPEWESVSRGIREILDG